MLLLLLLLLLPLPLLLRRKLEFIKKSGRVDWRRAQRLPTNQNDNVVSHMTCCRLTMAVRVNMMHNMHFVNMQNAG